jgi:Metallo-peptidase family M12B Reprolysin-like
MATIRFPRLAISYGVRLLLAASLGLLLLFQMRAGRTGAAPLPPELGSTDLSVGAVGDSPGPLNGPDAGLEVPWNGTYWQTMPNFTWAACDVSRNTRKAIDVAIGQWNYATTNQGIPIHLTETACTNGNTTAQIRIFEAQATDLPGADRDVFGLTQARDTRNKVCGLDVTNPCVAQTANVYLFTDNWEVNQLTYAQAAKTIAHEIGHAIGLGHAHFCNFDSIMAQSCEPILQGLGIDDIQSIDALVDNVRAYFNLPPMRAQPPSTIASGQGMSITYKAGYNLVSGPRGTNFAAAASPLFTFLPGDSSYRSISSSQPTYSGYGYWAYFAQDTTVQLNGSGSPFYTAIVDPNEWFLVGNESGSAPMRVVIGAQTVYLYDSQAKQYKTSDTIPVGQAAWVRSDRNGLVAVASTSLTRNQMNCYLNLGSPDSC